MNNSCTLGLTCVSAWLLLGTAAPRLCAQSDNFNSGTDTGWTRYTLPLIYGATFSFPADDTGGKAYKISAPPTGADPYHVMNARAGSLRTDVIYNGRFSVGTDLLAWNESWHQEAGLAFFFSDIGLGTSDGYTSTYSSAYHNLYISRVLNEAASSVGEVQGVYLDQTHRYRLVVSSHDGYTFVSQLFDKADLSNPWISAVCQDFTYSSGVCGLFTFEQTYPSATEGAEATFDNYVAMVPGAGTLPAAVTDLSPQPSGKDARLFPTVTAVILDRDTSVDTASIALSLDGVRIPSESLTIDPQVYKANNPSSGAKSFPGATVAYAITNLFRWGSQHTNRLVFQDSAAAWHTNTWVWTSAYPNLAASNSLPIGSLNVRGFDTRMVQSANGGTNLDNSLARALQQLAIPPTIPIDLTATSRVQVLNWNKTSSSDNVPGLCPGSYINIAVESYAYLELTAGVHRFHVVTDDRAGFYTGANLLGAASQTLWECPGNTGNATFDFAVEADGLYPLRSIWEETAGGAVLNVYSVDLNDLSETLINDPSDPANVVKAWYPLVCCSAASVTGPFKVDATAVNVPQTTDIVSSTCPEMVVGQMVTGGTFTIPAPAATRFYRLDGPRRTKITGFTKTGSTVTITYRVQ